MAPKFRSSFMYTLSMMILSGMIAFGQQKDQVNSNLIQFNWKCNRV
jgi:hypothetical protein